MPDIKLGPTGSEITLPVIRSFGGGDPGLEFGWDPQVDLQTMSDGSLRAAFFGNGKRAWSYVNGAITAAELAAIQAVIDLRAALRFQNNWESATWYDVIVTEFSHPSISTMLGNLSGYRFAVSIKIQQL